MNHVMHMSLFGKLESQESIQESWNQAKNVKIPGSRQRKFGEFRTPRVVLNVINHSVYEHVASVSS